MALSPQVVQVVVKVLEELASKKEADGKPIKVACLGYPDILLPLESFPFKDKLEPRSDSNSVTRFHSRPAFTVPTAESFFSALGAELTVLDVKQWKGNEVIIDLNKLFDVAVPGAPFDLLIDNGTVEHCFNAPMAMWNIRGLVRPGGFVVHWNPHYMPNHGFYNFSGTFFNDWYVANGGSIRDMTLWNFEIPEEGKPAVEVGYMVPTTSRFSFNAYNNSLLTVVEILEERKGQPVWPVQTKYKKMGLT